MIDREVSVTVQVFTDDNDDQEAAGRLVMS
jgi:hypothetical protein